MSTESEIKETLRLMPNLTSAEIHKLLPDRRIGAVHTAVSKMLHSGVIHVSGHKGEVTARGREVRQRTYALGRGDATLPLPTRKNNIPTPIGYAAQINALKAQIEELEKWKHAALERYPDLAVAPTVLRARQLVADELAAGGDNILAAAVRRGEKDTTLMMRVTIKALEEGE